jgi:hypothetical protein
VNQPVRPGEWVIAIAATSSAMAYPPSSRACSAIAVAVSSGNARL